MFKAIDNNIVEKVFNGDYGYGDDRKARLTAEGYNFFDVQKAVNKYSGHVNTPKYYTVRDGDTLDSIASRYNISKAQLCEWNSLIDTVVIGDKLRVT